VSTVPPVVKTKTFIVDLQPQFVVDNLFVRKNQDNYNVLIVDMRTLDQSKKLTKHPRALTAGNIPGSIKFPVHGLYMDHAELKSPQELLWVLKNRGITPDKTVVITCNTGAFAGALPVPAFSCCGIWAIPMCVCTTRHGLGGKKSLDTRAAAIDVASRPNRSFSYWRLKQKCSVAPPVGVSARRSAVAFPHSRHFNYRCKTCHHKWDGHTQVKSCSASNCHNGLSAPKKDSKAPFDRYYKTAFHQSCIGCHKETKIQNQKLEASKTVLRDTLARTGPTGCVQCHPKGPRSRL